MRILSTLGCVVGGLAFAALWVLVACLILGQGEATAMPIPR